VPALVTQPGALVTLLAVALLSTAIPFSLEFHALKRISATVYGTLIALEPAAATVAGAFLLGQAPGGKGLAAVALVTIAALGSAFGREPGRGE
ncbi:MAG: EamA family transporter, partial [Pseudomonadales bacterium]|nr:EamA family transporter [Pseudomonadales bacterium]